MTEKNSRKNETVDALFDAILSLESREECYAFFEDLCTVKEISDMAQRLEAAKLLLGGRTYDIRWGTPYIERMSPLWQRSIVPPRWNVRPCPVLP